MSRPPLGRKRRKRPEGAGRQGQALPINAALARLGAEPGPWIDPFAELGLHLERETAVGLAHGRRDLTADYWGELAEEWEDRQRSSSNPHRTPRGPRR